MHATLTSKGQITLPKKLRDLKHLKTGDKIEFVIDREGNVIVVPVTNPVTQLKGMVPKPRKPVSLKDMDEAIAKGASSNK